MGYGLGTLQGPEDAGQMLVPVTFIAILMTILMQAASTKWLARMFGLLVEP